MEESYLKIIHDLVCSCQYMIDSDINLDVWDDGLKEGIDILDEKNIYWRTSLERMKNKE